MCLFIKEMEASSAVVPVDLQPFLIAQKDIYRYTVGKLSYFFMKDF